MMIMFKIYCLVTAILVLLIQSHSADRLGKLKLLKNLRKNATNQTSHENLFKFLKNKTQKLTRTKFSTLNPIGQQTPTTTNPILILNTSKNQVY
jgi:hypothetical protein